jgi:Zn-dependent protease
MEHLVAGLIWYAVFLFSVVAHEAAHALSSKLGGDWTAYRGGQVSLDPLPHIRREPVGTILVPLLSYLLGGWMLGWASTPYDPYWAARYPRRAAWMALAGPAGNLLLVLAAFILIKGGLAVGLFAPPPLVAAERLTVSALGVGWTVPAAMLLSILLMLNLVLLVFNLIPLPPLDGSSALPLLLSASAARRYLEMMRQPVFYFMGMFIAWQIFQPLFSPILGLMLRLLY